MPSEKSIIGTEFFICRWRSCFLVMVYIIYLSLLEIVRKTTKLTDNYLFNTFNRVLHFYPVDIQVLKLIVSQNIWHRFSYCLLFNIPCQRSHGRFVDRWPLPPEGDIEMTVTSRGWQWDDYYLPRVTLRWLLPPGGDNEMTVTSRGWQWDDYYLQRVTLRWLLPP